MGLVNKARDVFDMLAIKLNLNQNIFILMFITVCICVYSVNMQSLCETGMVVMVIFVWDSEI